MLSGNIFNGSEVEFFLEISPWVRFGFILINIIILKLNSFKLVYFPHLTDQDKKFWESNAKMGNLYEPTEFNIEYDC